MSAEPQSPRACSVCGGSQFGDHAGRAGVLCLNCGALERHRAFAVTLAQYATPRGSATALESAPRTSTLYGEWLRARGWHYRSTDKWESRGTIDPLSFDFIDIAADLTDLQTVPSRSIELFIAQHVIEEIRNYPAALEEISRILEPGGHALMEIPWIRDHVTERMPEGSDYDNAWRFGGDLLDTMTSTFDTVAVIEQRAEGYRGDVFVCGRS